MCVFSIGSRIVGPIEVKFGMEDHIYPGEVLRCISFRHPKPRGQGAPKIGCQGLYSPNGEFMR